MTTPTPVQEDPRATISAFVKSVEKLGLLSSSTIADDYSNTVPCGMSYYQSPDGKTYSLLEAIDIPFGINIPDIRYGEDGLTYKKQGRSYEEYLNFHNISLTPSMNGSKGRHSLNLNLSGLIDRIELLDFPYGQYTLSLNHHSVATAKYDKVTKLLIFDFTDEENRSCELNTFIECFKGDREPTITNRQNYLNFGRIDVAEILYSNNVQPLRDIHYINIHGHFGDNGTYIEKNQKIVVSPQTYILNTRSIVESFDIETDQAGSVIVKINEADIEMFTIPSYQLRVKFNNPKKLYNKVPISSLTAHNDENSTKIPIKDSAIDYLNNAWGNVNHLLSEEININTVNLHGSTLSFIPIGCHIRNVRLHRYVIYKYPERVPISSR